MAPCKIETMLYTLPCRRQGNVIDGVRRLFTNDFSIIDVNGANLSRTVSIVRNASENYRSEQDERSIKDWDERTDVCPYYCCYYCYDSQTIARICSRPQ